MEGGGCSPVRRHSHCTTPLLPGSRGRRSAGAGAGAAAAGAGAGAVSDVMGQGSAFDHTQHQAGRIHVIHRRHAIQPPMDHNGPAVARNIAAVERG